MIPEFADLESRELDLMYSLPVYVAILIAGADGKIDNAELNKAINLANLKTRKARKELIEYYKVVNTDYEDKLKMALANLPADPRAREQELTERLKEVNQIWPKLDRTFAIMLYASLKDIARQIAEASGGVFGYMSVGYEESKLIDLKMINDPAR